VWPPVITNGAPIASVSLSSAKLGTTSRSDGTTEVTYNGHPLYTFAGDSSPGAASGEGNQGFGAEWDAFRPPVTTSKMGIARTTHVSDRPLTGNCGAVRLEVTAPKPRQTPPGLHSPKAISLRAIGRRTQSAEHFSFGIAQRPSGSTRIRRALAKSANEAPRLRPPTLLPAPGRSRRREPESHEWFATNVIAGSARRLAIAMANQTVTRRGAAGG
jgi:hypothetical protein